MPDNKINHGYLFYSSLILLFSTFFFSSLVSAEDQKPVWWNETYFQAPRQDSVLKQYFYVTDTFLSSAYTMPKKSPQRDLLFKKSIIAYTQLIEHFTAPGGASIACSAQYQIAQSYKELGDISRAKESYKKCLSYQKYIKTPPEDEVDFKFIAIVESSHKKMEQLK